MEKVTTKTNDGMICVGPRLCAPAHTDERNRS